MSALCGVAMDADQLSALFFLIESSCQLLQGLFHASVLLPGSESDLGCVDSEDLEARAVR